MAARERVTPTNLFFDLRYHTSELVSKRQMANWLTHLLVVFVKDYCICFGFNTLLFLLRIRMLAICVLRSLRVLARKAELWCDDETMMIK